MRNGGKSQLNRLWGFNPSWTPRGYPSEIRHNSGGHEGGRSCRNCL